MYWEKQDPTFTHFFPKYLNFFNAKCDMKCNTIEYNRTTSCLEARLAYNHTQIANFLISNPC